MAEYHEKGSGSTLTFHKARKTKQLFGLITGLWHPSLPDCLSACVTVHYRCCQALGKVRFENVGAEDVELCKALRVHRVRAVS